MRMNINCLLQMTDAALRRRSPLTIAMLTSPKVCSHSCQHADNVCAVLVVLNDQVRHFLQVLRRQPVAPLHWHKIYMQSAYYCNPNWPYSL